MTRARLADLVRDAAARTPEAIAVVAPDGAMSYGALDAAADRCAAGLWALGVRAGDRVGLWLDKSTVAVAAMQGALRLGAIYVPIDPTAPARRAAQLVADCAMRALVASTARAAALAAAGAPPCALLYTDEAGTDGADRAASPSLRWSSLAALPAAPDGATAGDALAYVLYTSGSTGRPKGVCLSHDNALAFVDWAATELAVRPDDHLANHAPFHFDLSVFDLYAAFRAGARVALVPEGAAYVPRRLVDFLVGEQVTIWYSVPSALGLMMDDGGLLEAEVPRLRAILFAGEVFPLAGLRRLHRRFAPSGVRLLNLYGPTETNVCTYHEVRDADVARDEPLPIGRACSGDRVWARVVEESGERVAAIGEEGELCVEGRTVMRGYWGQPPQGPIYATGDRVRALEGGAFQYVGRRDHMVKVRGHRVELGDVEAALALHEGVREVAVTVEGSGVAARLVAHVAAGAGGPPTLLALKRHCAERLPRAMIVDEVRLVPSLPRTPNGKIDRRALSGDNVQTRGEPAGGGDARGRGA